MTRVLVWFALAFAVFPCGAQSAARIDAIVRTPPGSGFAGVVPVARGDSIIFEKAYSQPTSKPITVNTKFNIASMTKGFTAAAILRLRSQHRVSFSDPISRFFPHLPEQKREITVFHLLTHTSGLA